jgi:hypothetical protein
MVNVKNFVHHLLLNVLFENQLRVFDMLEMKIFVKILQLYPKLQKYYIKFQKKKLIY